MFGANTVKCRLHLKWNVVRQIFKLPKRPQKLLLQPPRFPVWQAFEFLFPSFCPTTRQPGPTQDLSGLWRNIGHLECSPTPWNPCCGLRLVRHKGGLFSGPRCRLYCGPPEIDISRDKSSTGTTTGFELQNFQFKRSELFKFYYVFDQLDDSCKDCKFLHADTFQVNRGVGPAPTALQLIRCHMCRDISSYMRIV